MIKSKNLTGGQAAIKSLKKEKVKHVFGLIGSATDRGMCCSFNMKKADETYHKSQYASMVTEMQSLENRYRFEENC